MRRTFFVALLLFASTALAEDFEKVLLPVLAQAGVDGALGSRWRSQVVFYNGSKTPISLTSDIFYVDLCPGPAPCLPPELGPGETYGIPLRVQADGPVAELVYVRSETLSELGISLELYDESVPGGDLRRTHLPVVRENQTRNQLLLVGAKVSDSRTRSLLRIYSIDETADSVDVEITNADGNVDLHRNIELSVAAPPLVLPIHPAYGELTLTAEELPGIDAGTAVNIRIRSPRNDARLWAMASSTDNVTRDIDIITP